MSGLSVHFFAQKVGKGGWYLFMNADSGIYFTPVFCVCFLLCTKCRDYLKRVCAAVANQFRGATCLSRRIDGLL